VISLSCMISSQIPFCSFILFYLFFYCPSVLVVLGLAIWCKTYQIHNWRLALDSTMSICIILFFSVISLMLWMKLENSLLMKINKIAFLYFLKSKVCIAWSKIVDMAS
jgi:hypothetical protein